MAERPAMRLPACLGLVLAALAAVPRAAAGPEDPPPPLWMEAYSEGIYSRHEQDNTSGFGDVKLGKRFLAERPVDVYLKARMHRDARDFFWNNHLDAGVGVRAHPFKGIFLRIFAEAMTGYFYRTSADMGDLAGIQSRLDRTRASLDEMQTRFQGVQISVFRRAALGDTVFSRKALDSLDALLTAQGLTLAGVDAYLDSLETTRDSLRQKGDSLALIPAGPRTEFQLGFVFWFGRGQEAFGEGPFPLRFWCDLYADGIYSLQSRTVQTRSGGETYRDSTARFPNVILYLNPDVGAVLLEGSFGTLVGYGTLYAWFDSHRDWWNNRAMAGPGMRWQPLADLDLVLAAEYLWGSYYGRERKEDPNPYGRSFQDLRLQASFWYGLGF
jgi:hypothetical protein